MLAKILFIVILAVSVVGGFILFLLGFAGDFGRDTLSLLKAIGAVSLISGPIVAWLSAILIFGFGELIDRSISIDEKMDGSPDKNAAELTMRISTKVSTVSAAMHQKKKHRTAIRPLKTMTGVGKS